MYLKRKIDNILDNWLKRMIKKPILLTGIRQCNKTETIREFAKRNKLNLIELNFWTNSEFCSFFEDNIDVDTLISTITLKFTNIKFDAKNTLIFFEEIQDCPKAKLFFKILKTMEDI